ncbi:MAG: hypothetical protein A2V88_03095 [Elusimicrobia bacterium RBG_16_66_12]|nr:MAG: hypothetical protein A2V88_03095 [Elusimicrobia bacterium RBG_16_66_12]
MRVPKALRGTRGSGLILSLIALTAFSMMAVVVYRVTRAQVRESLQVKRQAQAQALAEAGLEVALNQLYINQSWAAGYTKASFGGGSFTVAVSTDSPPWISVSGYSAAIPGFGSVARSARARAAYSVSTGAVVGAGGGYAMMAQSEAASYGTVNSYSSTINPDPAVFDSNANVWSNAAVLTTAGAVRIYGNAYYYSGTAPSAATVSGSVAKSTYTQTLPASSACAAIKITNDNTTGLSPQSYYNPGTKDVAIPAGMTATLAPGNYYFRRLTVNGVLNVNTSTGGTANICVSSYIRANAGCQFNNLGKIPARLMIYGDGANTTHNFRCGTPLHAKILDKSSTLEIDQTVYGRVTGNRTRVRAGAVLHFDTEASAATVTGVSAATGTWTAGFDRL